MMPQVHLVESLQAAFQTAVSAVWPAPDDRSALVACHLVTEALLYRFLQTRFRRPDALDEVKWTYRETLTLAKCLRSPNSDEDWLWRTLGCLNSTRNRLSHDIDVPDLANQIERMYGAAGRHIDIHWPNADPSDREANRLKYFLLILCGVVHKLQDDSPGI